MTYQKNTDSIPIKVALLSALPEELETDPIVKFRLTYEGELRAARGDKTEGQREPLAPHKHEIRRHFHRQLRHLWKTDRFLSTHKLSRAFYPSNRPMADDSLRIGPGPETYVPMVEAVADQHHKFGYRFVPLVREEWSLLCSLDILFLRRDFPGGGLIHQGDIDNRIKTLIDALRCPKYQHELVGADALPGPDDDPFFCLLEDDSLVSHLTVEADRLLDEPAATNADQRKVRTIVTVELRTYYATMFNASLVG